MALTSTEAEKEANVAMEVSEDEVCNLLEEVEPDSKDWLDDFWINHLDFIESHEVPHTDGEHQPEEITACDTANH